MYPEAPEYGIYIFNKDVKPGDDAVEALGLRDAVVERSHQTIIRLFQHDQEKQPLHLRKTSSHQLSQRLEMMKMSMIISK